MCTDGSLACQCVQMGVPSSLSEAGRKHRPCLLSRALSTSLEELSFEANRYRGRQSQHRGEAVQGGAGGEAAPGDASQSDRAAVDGLHDGIVARGQCRRCICAAACALTGRARASRCVTPGCVDARRVVR